MKISIATLAVALSALPVSSSIAQLVYSENFDVDPTASWTVNGGPSDETANFFFDYSTAGIPTAPNSGGSTRGLKMYANHVNGIFGGFSVSPTGQSFVGSYELRFDLWINFNGPAPVGGSGSTQITGAGIGTAGATPQWPGGIQDSVWFATTGDGNSASDYRAYSTAAPTSYPDASPIYAAGAFAGNRNASAAYYAGLGGATPPAAQTGLFPQQTGAAGAGAPAFAWHDVRILKLGNTITWTMDGLLLATVDASTVTLGGSDILLMYSDTNATSSSDPNDVNLLFGLFDNITVTLVPEPGTPLLSLLGAIGVYLARRKRKES